MASSTGSVEISTIRPSDKHNIPPPPSKLSLHGLDPSDGYLTISLHRFYRPPKSLTFTEIIANLKSSLAEAIELYPPIAGTIRADEKGELYIALDGQGVPFHVEIKESPFAGDCDDVSPNPSLQMPTPSPALLVKFSCGTIGVAAVLHHSVSDLAGYFDFLILWGKLARGESVDLSTIPQDWHHAPGRFFPTQDNVQPPRAPTGYKVQSTPPAELPIFLPAEAQTWKFTKNSVAQLKRDFLPSQDVLQDAPDAWISSGDALTALIWGVMTRARESAKVPRENHGFGRSSEASRIETIATAADGRERSTDQKMVGQYLGNFNNLFVTTVPRTDLLSLSTQAGSRVALALRRSLNEQLSVEKIGERIRFFEVPEYSAPPSRIVWEADTVFTNWSKFDFQGDDMDFGWGKPFEGTSGGGALPGGFGRLWKSTGDIMALLAVEKEGADAMKNDPLLTKYASLVKVS